MKVHILFLATLSLICSTIAKQSADVINSENDKLFDAEKDNTILKAIVNKYADRLFENIHNFAITHGLDPMPLQDYTKKVINATVSIIRSVN
ncbi:unnamed protein product [Acanthoscelides obtectus]|uniref:Uncharacterized protein n=1 Tax=Acanthoscelides obtectus TaxID=200917 RepID=A0A9P0PV41_ACAOB|nr:unnamed protein product [Acanthoscelides obtectus]CAK1629917.1 hypothetical protein AOBTE_LOCUS6039 [Acanthoscelides obtectus]